MEKVKNGILKIIQAWKKLPKQMKRDAIEIILSIILLIWIPESSALLACGWVIKLIWDKVKHKPWLTFKIKK